LVRSVRARPSGSPLAWRLAGYLRAVSSSADVPSGDLRCGPTRASAEARLRAQLGDVPLHVTRPHLRGAIPRHSRPASAPGSLA